MQVTFNVIKLLLIERFVTTQVFITIFDKNPRRVKISNFS